MTINAIPAILKKLSCSRKRKTEHKLMQINRAALATGNAKLNSLSFNILSQRRKLRP